MTLHIPPLHMTKVAFAIDTLDDLRDRLARRAIEGPLFLTTRYLPKRHLEMAGSGSLFWILKHQLVARSPIFSFGEAEGGRVAIFIDPQLVLTHARPKRAHQGWRYLEDKDAPMDLGGGTDGIEDMPAVLLGELAGLALI